MDRCDNDDHEHDMLMSVIREIEREEYLSKLRNLPGRRSTLYMGSNDADGRGSNTSGSRGRGRGAHRGRTRNNLCDRPTPNKDRCDHDDHDDHDHDSDKSETKERGRDEYLAILRNLPGRRSTLYMGSNDADCRGWNTSGTRGRGTGAHRGRTRNNLCDRPTPNKDRCDHDDHDDHDHDSDKSETKERGRDEYLAILRNLPGRRSTLYMGSNDAEGRGSNTSGSTGRGRGAHRGRTRSVPGRRSPVKKTHSDNVENDGRDSNMSGTKERGRGGDRERQQKENQLKRRGPGHPSRGQKRGRRKTASHSIIRVSKSLFHKNVGSPAYMRLLSDHNDKPEGSGAVDSKSTVSVVKAMRKMHGHDRKGQEVVVKECINMEGDMHGRPLERDGNATVEGTNANATRLRDEPHGRWDNGPGLIVSSPAQASSQKSGNRYVLKQKFFESSLTNCPFITRVLVSNMADKVDEKKLREIFMLAGRVINAELSTDKEGICRGSGVVEYEHPVEAMQAVSMLHNQMLFDQRITVRMDHKLGKSHSLMELPEGLMGVGMGFGIGGAPLPDITRILSSSQKLSSGFGTSISACTPAALGAEIGLPLNVAAGDDLGVDGLVRDKDDYAQFETSPSGPADIPIESTPRAELAAAVIGLGAGPAGETGVIVGNDPMELTEGVHEVVMGFGAGGEPLQDVTRNLPSCQKLSSEHVTTVSPLVPAALGAEIGLPTNLAAGDDIDVDGPVRAKADYDQFETSPSAPADITIETTPRAELAAAVIGLGAGPVGETGVIVGNDPMELTEGVREVVMGFGAGGDPPQDVTRNLPSCQKLSSEHVTTVSPLVPAALGAEIGLPTNLAAGDDLGVDGPVRGKADYDQFETSPSAPADITIETTPRAELAAAVIGLGAGPAGETGVIVGNDPMELTEGVHEVVMGIGAGGDPPQDVTRNLPSCQKLSSEHVTTVSPLVPAALGAEIGLPTNLAAGDDIDVDGPVRAKADYDQFETSPSAPADITIETTPRAELAAAVIGLGAGPVGETGVIVGNDPMELTEGVREVVMGFGAGGDPPQDVTRNLPSCQKLSSEHVTTVSPLVPAALGAEIGLPTNLAAGDDLGVDGPVRGKADYDQFETSPSAPADITIETTPRAELAAAVIGLGAGPAGETGVIVGNDPMELTEGVHEVVMGIGAGGDPPQDVTRNLPSCQKLSSEHVTTVSPLEPAALGAEIGLPTNLAAGDDLGVDCPVRGKADYDQFETSPSAPADITIETTPRAELAAAVIGLGAGPAGETGVIVGNDPMELTEGVHEVVMGFGAGGDPPQDVTRNLPSCQKLSSEHVTTVSPLVPAALGAEIGLPTNLAAGDDLGVDGPVRGKADYDQFETSPSAPADITIETTLRAELAAAVIGLGAGPAGETGVIVGNDPMELNEGVHEVVMGFGAGGDPPQDVPRNLPSCQKLSSEHVTTVSPLVPAALEAEIGLPTNLAAGDDLDVDGPVRGKAEYDQFETSPSAPADITIETTPRAELAAAVIGLGAGPAGETGVIVGNDPMELTEGVHEVVMGFGAGGDPPQDVTRNLPSCQKLSSEHVTTVSPLVPAALEAEIGLPTNLAAGDDLGVDVPVRGKADYDQFETSPSAPADITIETTPRAELAAAVIGLGAGPAGETGVIVGNDPMELTEGVHEVVMGFGAGGDPPQDATRNLPSCQKLSSEHVTTVSPLVPAALGAEIGLPTNVAAGDDLDVEGLWKGGTGLNGPAGVIEGSRIVAGLDVADTGDDAILSDATAGIGGGN